MSLRGAVSMPCRVSSQTQTCRVCRKSRSTLSTNLKTEYTPSSITQDYYQQYRRFRDYRLSPPARSRHLYRSSSRDVEHRTPRGPQKWQRRARSIELARRDLVCLAQFLRSLFGYLTALQAYTDGLLVSSQL